jgi:transketolase
MTASAQSPLRQLNDHGQAFWQDSLSRRMLDDGSLAARVRDQGLSGVTSNPAIFERALADAAVYEARIRVAMDGEEDPEAVYRRLASDDVRDACDLLLPVFQDRDGADGFVSLEVSPHLAHDPVGTVREARRLWDAVARPNLLIKVPGTATGLHAVETLLYDGINVNVTLLFGLDAYEETLQAHLRALERRLREGRPLDTVASVASFFLSRIDVAVDAQVRQRLYPEVDPRIRDQAQDLLGRTALACARLAYERLREVLASERWKHLAGHGARPQRLLWASTGTKDPADPDVKYIEPLIGPDTVSTMPEATAEAFADHGVVGDTLAQDIAPAHAVLTGLGRLGIDLTAIARGLLAEGVRRFVEPHERLVSRLDAQMERLRRARESGHLRGQADRLRAEVIRMTTAAGSGHPTSCLSCAELVAALFFHEMRWDPADPRARHTDRFLLSKGHAAPILWSALHEAGAIASDPMTLRQAGSDLEGHPTPANPWVPVATGSLGQGLAAANGMALANRLDGIDARIFCLMGDGECSEGSVWESAQFAADKGLAGVVAVVDVNGLEQSGPAPYGHDTSVLAGRFRAFGWRTLEIDGHDIGAVVMALEATRLPGPTAILARTIKGRGVSFLEGALGWHGKVLDTGEADRALVEIAAPTRALTVAPRRVAGAGAPRPSHPEPLAPAYIQGEQVATRSAFGDALAAIGAEAADLVVLDGDVKDSTRTERFAERFPERFVEAQIAEQNMVGVALGLAASGKRPCVATFAAFLTRAHDFLRMAAHSRPANLFVCGSHAGVSIGPDGPSQMGLEDIALFRALIGATVLYPCDAMSTARLTLAGLYHPGIVYLRTTRGPTPVIYPASESFPIGGSKTLAESLGDRITLVAAGITVHAALAAHERLRARGVPARVIDAYSVAPLDVETLGRAARETGTLLVVEDHVRAGGLGEAVAAQVGRLGRVFRLGVAREPGSAAPDEQLARHRLSAEAIEGAALAALERA